MEKQLWKAFNNLNNKLTRIQDMLNSKFGIKCQENADNIEVVDDASCEVGEMLDDILTALNDIAEMLESE